MPMWKLARSAAVAELLGLVALGCGDGGRTNPVTAQQQKVSAPESTSVTTQTTLPLNTWVHVSCALGGIGELVALNGDLHLQSHSQWDRNGGFHAEVHANPQGVSGVGLTSGDTYRGTGVTQESLHGAAGQALTQTLVINFRLIGQGSAANFMIHQVAHLTINANGELTAQVGSTEVDCR
jgi:hypothetical protein